LLAGALAQGLTKLTAGSELPHGFLRIHLRAIDAGASCAALRRTQQQAFARPHDGPALGEPVETFTQPLAALGMACAALGTLLDDVAQRQFAVPRVGAVVEQTHPKLAASIVDQPLVGALPIQMLAVPA
jgi:hypothetical protein